MFKVVAHAWQSWRSARSVFVMAAGALAVGIGATTAIYTVVNAVMLKPLEYPEGERFGEVFGATIGRPDARSSLSFDDWLTTSASSRLWAAGSPTTRAR
jgi:hypothetical protein